MARPRTKQADLGGGNTSRTIRGVVAVTIELTPAERDTLKALSMTRKKSMSKVVSEILQSDRVFAHTLVTAERLYADKIALEED